MSAVLAFDFGTARIGVAVGTTELQLAHPLETIAFEDNDRRFARIGALIAEWQPSQLVVGLPGDPEADPPHPVALLARRFANRLHGRFDLPVALVDERYTSTAASEMLNESGRRGRKQKPALDQVAAMQILQGWFSQD